MPGETTATSSSAVSSSAGPPTGQARAVGTPAAFITCLAKDLLPSSRAACADGPKQAIPASRTASAAPATRGTSGPTTTRSARQSRASAAIATGSATSTAAGSATARVPALPGAQASASTAGSEDRATHRACSRAPEPITSTRTDGESTAGVVGRVDGCGRGPRLARGRPRPAGLGAVCAVAEPAAVGQLGGVGVGADAGGTHHGRGPARTDDGADG